MIRLLGVELTRLRWRRAVIVLLVGATAVPLLVLGITAWSSRPVSADEVREAESLAAQEAEMPYVAREVARCERRPDRFGAADAGECRELMSPQAEWYLHRTPLEVESVLRNEALALVILVTGLVMLAATTFVGADWTSGSMSNQLLFEPRRGLIWLAKAGAVVLMGAVATTLLLGLLWAGVAGLVAQRDLPVPDGFVGEAWAFSGRAVALCAAACLGAYAVTMLFRSTVFTLGALFAVTIVSLLVLAVLGLSERWMPHTNVAAVLYDGVTYFREPPAACFEGPVQPGDVDCSQERRLSAPAGLAYLGTALVVAVTASLGSFLRRDVP